jgi:carbon-monoxide dehydrogenase catalytic subunit
MELTQKKTKDTTVESFFPLAAQEGVNLAWDRFETQVPECGFCESGLSCRDCLQGPCISHPFKGDMNKAGVCGKDKETFAAHTLLRLAVKGSMGYLDQAFTLAEDLADKKLAAQNSDAADTLVKQIQELSLGVPEACFADFPQSMLKAWDTAGIRPEGVARDLIKASQKLEGGAHSTEQAMLWVLKCALLGGLTEKLLSGLRQAAYESAAVSSVGVNLGVLEKDKPNIVIHGFVPPSLKAGIAAAAASQGVAVSGVCTEALQPPHVFPQATNQGSQEIPVLTGAVDLIVAGDQGVNPSLQEIARQWQVPVISTETLQKTDPEAAAAKIVADAQRSYETRVGYTRNVPAVKETGQMGFTAKTLAVDAIAKALDSKGIKGVVLLAGGNNVKYSQDNELLALVNECLKDDILVLAEGQASVTLAKYGFLNPGNASKAAGGLQSLLSELGSDVPPVIDISLYGVTQFFLDLEKAAGKGLKDLPVRTCFCEANGTKEAVMALWLVAMGVCTYFWPSLPVTGSQSVVAFLNETCAETFGARLHVISRKISAEVKAQSISKELLDGKALSMSGKEWRP